MINQFTVGSIYNFVGANSQELFTATFVLLLTFVVFYIAKTYFLSYLRKYDDNTTVAVVADAIERIGFITAAITGIYLVTRSLSNLPNISYSIAYFAFIFAWTWQVIVLISRIVDYASKVYMQRSTEVNNQSIIRFLANATKVAIWILAGLLILSNLGYDVNSLIAGLGVGGIAVALAVQAVLGDIISSVSIVVDKPFKVGDFIIVDDLMGTVDKIGLRSTRVVSIDGEEIIMPNSELISSYIRNFGKIQRRRALHVFGLTYESDSEKLKEVSEMVKAILRENEMVEKDTFRVNLIEYGDSSINYEAHFYIKTTDYNEFLDIQEDILFKIKDKFAAEGLDFAYPTQTLFVNK